MQENIQSSVRSHMANERTHLAYLRTSLSLISFGITLNRFSVFLQENHQLFKGRGILHQTAYIGIGIVLLGIVILGWSLARFRKVELAIDTNNYVSSSRTINIMTILVIVLGGLSTFWMFVNRN